MIWLDALEAHWVWLTLGLLLAAAEMLVPGVFLLWLGLAAIATGLVAWLLPIGVPLQVVLFTLVSGVVIALVRKYLPPGQITAADPVMNQRGARLVGEHATVTQAIADGQGRIRLGDSEWIARGADAPAGARVRITGADGAVLLVEPV